jgi:protein-tyrosine phosphatase
MRLPFRKKPQSLPKIGVLFVCMGNICRSPTAEGVFRHRVKLAGLENDIHIDSAGTHAYHIGNPPDARSIQHAARRRYDLAKLRARQVIEEDFPRFRYLLAMDEANLTALQKLQPEKHDGHVGLFLDLVPDLSVREVPDPYYGGADGFELVLDLVESGADALLDRVRLDLELLTRKDSEKDSEEA